jgi:hypothetical protein
MAWKWIRMNLGWCSECSGTKTKLYEPVSNCMCQCLKYFGTKRTHSHVPELKGEALFLELFFSLCLPIVGRYKFVNTNLYYMNLYMLTEESLNFNILLLKIRGNMTFQDLT